ncbi:MAG: prephenate dehydratase [Planctomycetes bacterium]|nr:prephenate dehydratase [Planctomycetota bacterium]
MIKVATLGPQQTFSELAAKAWIAQNNQNNEVEIKLYPSIRKVFLAVGNEEDYDYGVLPIENMVDGYVQPVLDLLLHGNLKIVDELLLPIEFAFVSNGSSLKEVKRVYAQFVTQGQCSEFLENNDDWAMVTTQSNGESLEKVLEGDLECGAIVPVHCLKNYSFPFVIDNVNDYSHNQTRFIVVSRKEREVLSQSTYQTSIVVVEGTDRPGMLSDILQAFSKRRINLGAIMSRPTKETLGKYHFFVDFEGNAQHEHIKEALSEMEKCGNVKVLGSYPKAKALAVQLRSQPIDLTQNPFMKEGEAPKVKVVAGKDPYQDTLEALKAVDLSAAQGKKVLLKPNIGRLAKQGSGIITDARVVAAAIDAFRQAGADVSIGESPIAGVNTLEAYKEAGITEIAEERNCPLIDMDKRKPVVVSIPEGKAINTLKVCADLFDFDIIVSIPVMKMHMHTGVTLGLKNMKGCLWRRSKVDLHMLPPVEGIDEKSLNVAIVDMAMVLRPHLTIVDGTVGMEGLGPSAGEAKECGVIVVGADVLAVDAVSCELMGCSAVDIPHLRMSADRGLGSINIEDCEVSPADWRKSIVHFSPVPENIAIDFPGVNILDDQSCSACQSTLLLFLKRFGKELGDYYKEGDDINFAIGKGHVNVPDGTVCIGVCTREHCEKGVYVKGCPPVASSIMKKIIEEAESSSLKF